MMLLLRTEALRAIESSHAEVAPSLMERAGQAAAKLALQLQQPLSGPPLILAGPGNNGGDAFVAARRLKAAGLAPVVVFTGQEDSLPQEARLAHESWRLCGGVTQTDVPSGHYGLVVDGLFGMGLARPLAGAYAQWIKRINAYEGPVLALDCPSGLDAETGRILGCAVRAQHTLTFMAAKPGLLTLDGPDHCGTLHVADLGLAKAVEAAVEAGLGGTTLDQEAFAPWLGPRRRNSHKGSYGCVTILGGAPGMTGAALLAGRAALHLGAGRVYGGLLAPMAVDIGQPELMVRSAEESLALATVVAIGPGLGASQAAVDLLRRAVEMPVPLVVDADGLNRLAEHPVIAGRLARRSAPTLLTPHPAEAARLLGTTVEVIQGDRVSSALQIAHQFNAHTVLKGCGSLLAGPDGRWCIAPQGNPGLASAGSGDVLTGIIAALLAQGWPAGAALAGAVYLHGRAAEILTAQGVGPIGLTASELIGTARRLLNTLSQG